MIAFMVRVFGQVDGSIHPLIQLMDDSSLCRVVNRRWRASFRQVRERKRETRKMMSLNRGGQDVGSHCVVDFIMTS